MPTPVSLAVVDYVSGTGSDDVFWGAYLFVITPDDSVRKFISGDRHAEVILIDPYEN